MEPRIECAPAAQRPYRGRGDAKDHTALDEGLLDATLDALCRRLVGRAFGKRKFVQRPDGFGPVVRGDQCRSKHQEPRSLAHGRRQRIAPRQDLGPRHHRRHRHCWIAPTRHGPWRRNATRQRKTRSGQANQYPLHRITPWWLLHNPFFFTNAQFDWAPCTLHAPPSRPHTPHPPHHTFSPLHPPHCL